jgi:hypothetical protein
MRRATLRRESWAVELFPKDMAQAFVEPQEEIDDVQEAGL